MSIEAAQQELLNRLNDPERTRSRWEQMVAEKPDHSEWYIERFEKMAAAGADLEGEARLVNALVKPASKILDAGCGPGRHANYLALLGHQVTGIDIDAKLIAQAQADWRKQSTLAAKSKVNKTLAGVDLLSNPNPAPGLIDPKFLQGDITTISSEVCPDAPYDLVMCAGNVLTFLMGGTQKLALQAFGSVLGQEGRCVIGFGAGRGYEFDTFLAETAAAGFEVENLFSTWDLRPFKNDSGFLVAVLAKA